MTIGLVGLTVGLSRLAVGRIRLTVGLVGLTAGLSRLTVGRIRLAVGLSRLAVGRIRLTVGLSRLAVGLSRLAVGRGRLTIGLAGLAVGRIRLTVRRVRLTIRLAGLAVGRIRLTVRRVRLTVRRVRLTIGRNRSFQGHSRRNAPDFFSVCQKKYRKDHLHPAGNQADQPRQRGNKECCDPTDQLKKRQNKAQYAEEILIRHIRDAGNNQSRDFFENRIHTDIIDQHENHRNQHNKKKDGKNCRNPSGCQIGYIEVNISQFLFKNFTDHSRPYKRNHCTQQAQGHDDTAAHDPINRNTPDQSEG